MAEATELKRAAPSETLPGALAAFFFDTSIGAKVVMAFTGLGLGVFILAHLAGNLTVFAGREVFNGYAQALQGNPPLLWGLRIALLIGFPLHILTAIKTVQQNRAARPVEYAYGNRTEARAAAKTMLLSGLVVLAFFGYHLAHFTLHKTGPMPGSLTADGHWDAYTMLVMGFQQPLIAGAYVVAQLLLGGHLSHGMYSLFQHLGVWGKKWTPWLKATSVLVGYGICFAFISIPVCVYLGIVKP